MHMGPPFVCPRIRCPGKLSGILCSVGFYHIPQTASCKPVDCFLVLEPYLPFCGMHIEIDLSRVEIQKEKKDGVFITRDDPLIRHIHRMGEGCVFHRPTVDKNVLMGSAVPEIAAI